MMPMTRFDPVDELRPLPVGRSPENAAGTVVPSREGPLAYDVYRVADPGLLCLDFDVPGVDPAAIEVNVEQQVVTIAVARELPAGVEMVERHRSHGSFLQRFVLPGTCDAGHLRARCENGVLHLEAPLRRRGPPRTVAVEAQTQRGVRTRPASEISALGAERDLEPVGSSV